MGVANSHDSRERAGVPGPSDHHFFFFSGSMTLTSPSSRRRMACPCPGEEELARFLPQPVPDLVLVLPEFVEVTVLAALHDQCAVVVAESEDRTERPAIRPARRRVLLELALVLLRPFLEILHSALFHVPKLNPQHMRSPPFSGWVPS